MASETVKIYAKDQNGDALVGVLVRVFDETGAAFHSQNYTALVGSDAIAEFTLDGDDPALTYTIRMSKAGVAFDGQLGDDSKTPQLIEIYSPPANSPTGTNNFEVQGQTFERPVATDPRLCRCSGFFKDITGQPLPNLEIFLINQFKPAVVDGEAVLGTKVQLRTDADGYVEVDLYRLGIYNAMVQSIQAAEADTTGAIVFDRTLYVPDLSSANLVDLLFSVISGITWVPASVLVGVGASIDLVPTITASDGRVLDDPLTACSDLIYDTDDHEIALVGVEDDKLVITGVAAGSANLTVVPLDQTVVMIPATAITGVPLAITVT